MGNSLLTAQQITREAMDVLHAKLNFISTINRQYDSSFAVSGAKIGSQLKIRLPNEYTVRSGRNYVGQDTNEQAETLVVATQKGVDSQIYSDELTLSMDDFKTRILEPQMSVLASDIEYDCLSMALDVANAVGTPGTTPGSTANQALLPWLQAKQRLDENLAPTPRSVQLEGTAATYTINGMSSLYQDSRTIAKQMTEGFLLRNSGHDYYHNTLIRRLTNGTVDNTTPVVNGAGQGGDGSIILGGLDALATVAKGQVFTIADVYDVHPETKQSWGRLKQFTVTAAATADGAGAVTLSFTPACISSGARQNVDSVPADTAAITFAGSASTSYPISLAYHRDAFAFVTADLEMPKGMDMAYKMTQDGISLRFVRWFDGDTDQWKSRFDVLYGYKTLRQQLACRIWG